MTKASKMEIYEKIELRYKLSDKIEKTKILDEFCELPSIPYKIYARNKNQTCSDLY